MVAF
ncbi:hypothetical protein D046_3025A, partial [Vibrio parahaemolyticus V-223/04]|jgi:hypothetical protein